MAGSPLVGILALQGAVREHARSLERCGAAVREVRRPALLDGCDALVMPGGESTTMWKLMRLYGLDEAVRQFGKPIFGTCAGMILLAGEVEGEERKLGLADIAVARNSFGRQVDSFEADLEVAGLEGGPYPAVFIRAPHIISAGPEVEVLARCRERIVLARDGVILVSSFHPELTGDDRLHRYFLESTLGR